MRGSGGRRCSPRPLLLSCGTSLWRRSALHPSLFIPRRTAQSVDSLYLTGARSALSVSRRLCSSKHAGDPPASSPALKVSPPAPPILDSPSPDGPPPRHAPPAPGIEATVGDAPHTCAKANGAGAPTAAAPASKTTPDTAEAIKKGPEIAVEGGDEGGATTTPSNTTEASAQDAADDKGDASALEEEISAVDEDDVDEEEVPLVSNKESKAENDLERQKQRLLREAEDSLRVEELLSAENIHKYIYVTQVSTPTGTRWVDVWAKPALWENRILAKQSETEFAAYVTKALQRQTFPRDMFTSVSSSGALPLVQVRENWVCLTLRVAKDAYHKGDPYNSAMALGALSSADGDRGGGNDGERRPESATTSLLARLSGSEVDEEDEYRFSALEALRKRAVKKQQLQQKQRQAKQATVEGGRKASSTASPVRGDPVADDPASYYYYDEDKNQFLLLPQSTRDGLAAGVGARGWLRTTGALLSSWFSPWRHVRQRETLRVAEYRRLRRRRAADNSYSSIKAPTISEDTERLNIFLMKEVHPMEEERHKTPITEERFTSATKIGVLELDEHGNRVFNATKAPRTGMNTERQEPETESSEAAAEKHRPTAADPSTPTNGQDKKEAAGGNGSAPEPPPIMESKREPESNLRLRWVVMTVHRESIPFVAETLLRWQEFINHGGRLVSDESPEIMQRSFANNRDVGWEEIVRHLFQEDVRALQRASVAQTRALDVLETEVFDDNMGSAEHMRRMRSMLRELHLLSRRANMYTDILKESRIAYSQLKKAINSPLLASDRKALSALDSAVSFSRSLEEQSASLLVLQFSVAMNQMERHLRTLTIFSTFFTPLSFIVSYFSMPFASLENFCQQDGAIYVFVAIMLLAAFITSRWISRNVQ